MVIMTGWKDDKLLTLKGTPAQEHNSTYLSHHDEGTLYSSILWHGKFGHMNHDILHVL
jgi:hypothetical protein